MNTELTHNDSKEKHDSKAKETDLMLIELVLRNVHNVHTPGLSCKLEKNGKVRITFLRKAQLLEMSKCWQNILIP